MSTVDPPSRRPKYQPTLSLDNVKTCDVAFTHVILLRRMFVSVCLRVRVRVRVVVVVVCQFDIILSMSTVGRHYGRLPCVTGTEQTPDT